MKLSVLFTINAVVATLFGLAFVLIPASGLAPYGIEANSETIAMSRLFGAALIGFGLITWFARNSEDSDARQAIVLGLFLSEIVGVIVALQMQISGVVNTLGWSTVVIYLFFAVGYGYFQFAKPKEA